MAAASKNSKNTTVRPVWSSPILFVLAVSGATVGLNNISLFPTLIANNGGGAFLILYVISLLIIGLPMVMLEMVIGRSTASNPVSAIQKLVKQNKLAKHWVYIGLMSIFAGLLILSFYSVIAGWSIAYIFRMLGGAFTGLDANGVSLILNNLVNDPERLITWHTLFVMLTAYIISRGIEGIERWVRILMPLFFALLLTIVIFAAFTSRYTAGVEYLFAVDFTHLYNMDTILKALSMAFFSLGLGRGAIIVFSSYLPKTVSIARTAGSVVMIDIIVVLLAGLAIFPIILSSDVAIDDSVNLIFETLPMAFVSMPYGSLLGAAFFLMLFIAALTSAIALLEPIIEWMTENKSIPRKNAAIRCGLIVWVLGLGTVFSFNIWANYLWTLELDLKQVQLLLFKDKSFLDVVEYISSTVMLPVSGFLLVFFAGHFIKKQTLEKELTQNKKLFDIWYFILQYITPMVLFVVLLNQIFF